MCITCMCKKDGSPLANLNLLLSPLIFLTNENVKHGSLPRLEDSTLGVKITIGVCEGDKGYHLRWFSPTKIQLDCWVF